MGKYNFKTLKSKTIKCKKCNNDLDIRITTELLSKDKNKEPKTLIIYGVCDKCKIVYMLDIILIEDISKNIIRDKK